MAQRAASAATRAKILEAADELFGEVGFESTTTRLIGERSGVNKALIHYHFRDKDGLLGSLLDRYYDRLEQTLRSSLGEPGTVRERLARLIDAYVDFLADNRSFSRIVQREVAGSRHIERVTDRMLPLFRMGSELARQAYPAARTGPLAAEQLLISFYGMVVSWFTYGPVLEPLLGSDPLAPRALAQRKEHLKRMLALTLDAVEEAGLGNAEK